jgi:Heparinase II/III-like protein
LSNCDYQDFRPIIQSTHYLSNHTRCYTEGPWDEDLLWLFGPDALKAPESAQQRTNLKADSGGYYTLRSDAGFVFTRAAGFRHRPAQADMLHVDLWWQGQNIAMDAGTFSYNAPAPWNNPLAHTAYHNTVTVDDQDQMNRAGKFLWLPWLRGRARAYRNSPDHHLAYWEGEHDGYERLPAPARHRRAILRLGEHWLVLDDLNSAEKHSYRLHWLLLDAGHEWDAEAKRLRLDTSAGAYYLQAGILNGEGACSLVRADESSPRGWRASYYNYREPALSFEMTDCQSSLRFYSLFGPEPCDVKASDTTLQILTKRWQAAVTLQAAGEQKTLIASAHMEGAVEDRLEIA